MRPMPPGISCKPSITLGANLKPIRLADLLGITKVAADQDNLHTDTGARGEQLKLGICYGGA